jgi:hypothetical protein
MIQSLSGKSRTYFAFKAFSDIVFAKLECTPTHVMFSLIISKVLGYFLFVPKGAEKFRQILLSYTEITVHNYVFKRSQNVLTYIIFIAELTAFTQLD